MDHASTTDFPEPGPGTPGPQRAATASDLPQQPRDRRREKPLLSCLFCRSRKVRCDRRLPCETCTSKGIGMSCTYMTSASRKSSCKVSVGDRIQQLEALVRSLAQQQQQTAQTPAVLTRGPAADPSPPSFRGTPGASTTSPFGGATPPAPADDDSGTPGPRQASLSQNRERPASPAPSEPGRMRLHAHGANYVGSVHWAAVLDSISELREHYEEEAAARMLAANDHLSHSAPGPRLLYEPLQLTKADVLASIPARRVVDRMVARYFNAQGVVPEALHRGHFLREYERFWQEAAAVPFTWIGLLFSIMFVSTQFQQSIEDPADPETSVRVHLFRERTIHCLVLGRYTRGGNCVLETMINYLSGEMLLSKDADIGLWLVQGVLVQLALSLGYHRDPQNFPTISPFTGEMRRRVWAVIVQLDLRLASQMGLPRLLKRQQCDTADPRNLFDTDFDEATVELPPSRPETEVTPMLYSLARNRIDKMNGLVSDLINDTHEHPYAEIMVLDRKLQDAEVSLPAIFQWQPLSQSFMVPPQIVMHRVLLQLAIQRVTVWLHRKYLAPAYTQPDYDYSRSACIRAAIKILEFQQMVDDETQQDGLLYPVRWMFTSSRVQAVFLLGMSILCYYLQLAKSRPNVPVDEDTSTKIYNLLRTTYPLWLRSSTVSLEARQAVEHLNVLLGLQGRQEHEGDEPLMLTTATTVSPSLFAPLQDGAMSFDQVTWDAYQECIASFPSTATSGAEFMYPLGQDASASSSTANGSMADLLLTNTVGLDMWVPASFSPLLLSLFLPLSCGNI
ncbi:hypothetical protein C8A03DRAFT_45831 [Achaetomium macrosporum]|uniref:Zn(2)-C6 fungal-type domain-containing protein n=1 Tax=Achaetomium macrosporum TaxID=79813 RepID=A0AAN7C664_9PEZI|nr:hypothetical protein C8A03DRAFT_45831 [Achaetomium macrosporum]